MMISKIHQFIITFIYRLQMTIKFRNAIVLDQDNFRNYIVFQGNFIANLKPNNKYIISKYILLSDVILEVKDCEILFKGMPAEFLTGTDIDYFYINCEICIY